MVQSSAPLTRPPSHSKTCAEQFAEGKRATEAGNRVDTCRCQTLGNVLRAAGAGLSEERRPEVAARCPGRRSSACYTRFAFARPSPHATHAGRPGIARPRGDRPGGRRRRRCRGRATAGNQPPARIRRQCHRHRLRLVGPRQAARLADGATARRGGESRSRRCLLAAGRAGEPARGPTRRPARRDR